MRAFDWANNPLGPPDTWPRPLKTLVSVMLGAGQPMFVAWGPERMKVLFIIGFAENVAVGNGYLEPGMELLTKPFTREALSIKVAGMLNHPLPNRLSGPM